MSFAKTLYSHNYFVKDVTFAAGVGVSPETRDLYFNAIEEFFTWHKVLGLMRQMLTHDRRLSWSNMTLNEGTFCTILSLNQATKM